jgi:exonuclease V gamma subunit
VQAAVAAEEDWKRDSNGKSHLTEPMVANSMFELADIWCLSTNIEEYVAFLDQLLGTVTMEKDGKTVRIAIATREFIMKMLLMISSLLMVSMSKIKKHQKAGT